MLERTFVGKMEGNPVVVNPPDPNAPVAAVAPPVHTPAQREIIRRHAALRSVGVEGSNGPHVYSNSRALYGFVKTTEFLLVWKPCVTNADGSYKAAKNIPMANIGNTNYVERLVGAAGTQFREANPLVHYSTDDEFEINAFLNYVYLRKSDMNPIEAAAAAILRARWILLGCANEMLNDTARPQVEHIIVDQETYMETLPEYMHDIVAAIPEGIDAMYEADFDLAIEFMDEYNDEDHGITWCVTVAETIWSAVEYAVRVRGHHWKDEYEGLYNRYFVSCFEGNFSWPKGISMASLCRTAIHPFGIKALAVMNCMFIAHGRIGQAGIIRLSGAPNGTAVVTSTYAAMASLKGEMWYDRFRYQFRKEFVDLEAARNAIMANKYGFHQSSRLYGAERVEGARINGVYRTTEEILKIGKDMACYAAGYVQAMRNLVNQGVIAGFTFANARVFEKYAADNPLLVSRINALIEMSVAEFQNAANIEAAVDAVFPEVPPNAIRNQLALLADEPGADPTAIQGGARVLERNAG